MPVPPKIVLIGAGNVASHLAASLKDKGCEIVQVYSRSSVTAQALAKKVKSIGTTDLQKLVQDADLYIVAIKDDAIASVLQQIQFQPRLIVHTSGSVNEAVFKAKFENYGVLYPLQTFSKNHPVNFSKVPIFLEANSIANLKSLKKIAAMLSKSIFQTDSTARKSIHVAAVFACNFSNHMYAIAEQLLQAEKIPFQVLAPLIEETARKALLASPAKLQTGPAVRNDSKVMKSHLTYLKSNKDFKKIYTLVSKSILDFNKQYGAK